MSSMPSNFPPLAPQGMGPPGGGFQPSTYSGQSFGNSNTAPTSRAAEWIFNQSGMVVILTLGLLGVWYVSKEHLDEFKTIRTQEKQEQREERTKFLSVLESCCKDRDKLAGFGN